MPKWTDQQSNAINARNRNVIVSAAAGSGKTAVLVERVIKLITDENNSVDLDRLLVVTFTKPAAAEMKSRISKRLQAILKNDPANRNALRQMALISSAKISTIDSFCYNLVKDNFFELGLSQDFTVLSETEAQIISDNAVNTALDAFFEEKTPEFISLVEMLSSPKDDKALVSAVKRLHTYINSQPEPLIWLNNAVEAYNPDIPLKDSIWLDALSKYVNDGLNCALNLAEEALSMIDEFDEAAEKYIPIIEDDISMINALSTAFECGWDEAAERFSSVSFKTLRGKNGYTAPYKEEVASRRKAYKSIIKDQLSPLFTVLEEDYVEDCKRLYPILKELCRVVERYDNEYRALKDERNAYTFSDVEHFALSLLIEKDENGNSKRSRLAEDLKNSFYEILVDEYQDTNEAQDALFKLLSNDKNLFMVGDVKQSIYRFRMAMPYIFTQKKNSFEDFDEKKEQQSARIILDKNFRSAKEICGFTNFLFSEFMSEETGELDYNETEYLNYGETVNSPEAPSIEYKILTDVKRSDFNKSEAAYIAETILKKINSGEKIFDGKEYRTLRFRDFAILLRAVKNHINDYNEVLTEYGIPVACENSTNLFDNNEIKILVSFLRVVDNPMQDIPLLTVMMSPLYGFTADELTEIKLEQKNTKCSLYTSVVNSSSEKVKAFLAEIDMFRKVNITMSVASFIRFVCEYKSVYAFACALGNGEQRCSNINKLIEFAEGFDSSQSIGLTSFLRLLNKIEQGDKGIESAALNPASENAVTLMSVHHSKGLEFPVVILAGTEKYYNYDELKQKLLLHPRAGLGAKLHNEEQLYQTDTIPAFAVKYLNKKSMMSENLRVLYVALTRAKQQFIPFITVDNFENKINKLSVNVANGKIEPFLCAGTSCDGDLLLMSALNHKGGKKLRSLSAVDVAVKPSDFDIDVEIIGSLDEINPPEEQEQATYSNELVEEIGKRIDYKYENMPLSHISSKRNASELDKSISNLEFFASSKPAFMSDGKMTAGQKGTAMHTFMQFCDYQNSKNNLEKEIGRTVEMGYISSEQAAVLNREALSAFFDGELAERMFGADNIYREIRVSSFVSLRELGEADSDEEVLVRGISDCVFEENGELVLVDYKTDRVKNENELLERYKNQIGFYKSVVSKTLGKPVKQAVLYSFCLGKSCYYK